MLRLLVAVLLGGLVAGSQYEFVVPKVSHPNLEAKDFQEVPDDHLSPEKLAEMIAKIEEEDEESFTSQKPMPMKVEPLHTFRTRDWELSTEDLEEVKEMFKVRAEDVNWLAFNEDADWTVIDSEMARDTYMAFAFRRAVVSEALLQLAQNVVTDDYTIDFFDDYQVAVECSSPKIGHSFDKFFTFRGKLHYVKFSYICAVTNPEEIATTDPAKFCSNNSVYYTQDQDQGFVNLQLSGFKLRTDRGNRVVVKTWRHFWSCEHGDFTEKIYPDLPMRLDAVGLTNADANWENRSVYLALKMFGLELLRPFRRQIPGFSEDMIKTLEHNEHLAFKKDYKNPKPRQEESLAGDTIGK